MTKISSLDKKRLAVCVIVPEGETRPHNAWKPSELKPGKKLNQPGPLFTAYCVDRETKLSFAAVNKE
jgi:hypothetical protein